MTFGKSLARGLQKCVANMWKGGDASDYDFTVVAEGTSFKCHRFILCACSGFFRGLFNSNMKEQLESRVYLVAISASTFDTIINAVYTGKKGLTNENLLDVWSATEMLQIGYLKDECQKFAMENISVDNCFGILDQATLFDAQNVIDHSLDFIVRHFKKVREQDDFLQLSFDSFYKVISHDSLATDCEELVVDAVLDWVKYTPRSAQAHDSLATDCEEVVVDAVLDWVKYTPQSAQGNNTEGDDDRNDEQSDDDPSTYNLSAIGNLENIHHAQTLLSLDIATDQRNTSPHKIEKRDEADTHTRGPLECNNANRDVGKDVSKKENRKQHLVQLMSACRLFTVKPSYLDNIMKNHAGLLFDTGAHTLMHEALMYTTDVCRRHDAWPEAAVHRTSSSHTHVMVFFSDNALKTYDLNTGLVTILTKPPETCESLNCTITIFDNIFHVLFKNSKGNTQELCMLSKEKTGLKVNSINNAASIILLPHGNYMYYSCLCNTSVEDGECDRDHSVYRFCCLLGHSREWLKCGELPGCGNCLVRFQKYILVFFTKTDVLTAQCYNTDTQETHMCTTAMSGTSQDMVSFKHREDVYILQRNGTLWKVFSTDTTPVDFELVSKLWDFDYSIKGCVLYKQTLFIFCDQEQFRTTLVSLPGICTNIQIINIESETACLPMILEKHKRAL